MRRPPDMGHDETIVEILWALAVPAVVVGVLTAALRLSVVELRQAGVVPSGPEFPLLAAATAVCGIATVVLLLDSSRRHGARARSGPGG